MSTDVLVVAPHADDETIGCAGTLLRHASSGDRTHWLLVTQATEATGYSRDESEAEARVIAAVNAALGFSSFTSLALTPAELDTLPAKQLSQAISQVVRRLQPSVIYLPFPGDTHSDHGVTFDAAQSATKWFRYPSVKKVLCYETLSETEFGVSPVKDAFRPNSFVDIGDVLERKLEILALYASQLGEFPFPRSAPSIRALAALRGSTCGCRAAEAFMVLKEMW